VSSAAEQSVVADFSAQLVIAFIAVH
jgi:hypothetical protein